MKPIEYNLGVVNLDTEKMIKLVVDSCEAKKLLSLVKERLMYNVQKYPENTTHLNCLKDFLNQMKG